MKHRRASFLAVLLRCMASIHAGDEASPWACDEGDQLGFCDEGDITSMLQSSAKAFHRSGSKLSERPRLQPAADALELVPDHIDPDTQNDEGLFLLEGPSKIVIYGRKMCLFTQFTRQKLDKAGVHYVFKDYDEKTGNVAKEMWSKVNKAGLTAAFPVCDLCGKLEVQPMGTLEGFIQRAKKCERSIPTAAPTDAPIKRTCDPTPSIEFGKKSGVEGWVDDHNHFRALHGAKPVTWDVDLAAKAKKVADNLHAEQSKDLSPVGRTSTNWPYKIWPFSGENRAMGYGPCDAATHGGPELYNGNYDQHCATASWYAEYNLWKGEGLWQLVDGLGHFTAMVWKGVDAIGCASVGKYHVCEYGSSKCKSKGQPFGGSDCHGDAGWTKAPHLPNWNPRRCAPAGLSDLCVEQFTPVVRCPVYTEGVILNAEYSQKSILPSEVAAKAACDADPSCLGYWQGFAGSPGNFALLKPGARTWQKGVGDILSVQVKDQAIVESHVYTEGVIQNAEYSQKSILTSEVAAEAACDADPNCLGYWQGFAGSPGNFAVLKPGARTWQKGFRDALSVKVKDQD